MATITPDLKEVRTYIKHMSLHLCDRALVDEFEDCLIPCVSSDAVRERLRAYVRARKGAPNFKRDPGHNNHRYIKPEVLQALLGTKAPKETVTCEECGKAFTPTRSDAKLCSPRCRQRAARNRRVAA